MPKKKAISERWTETRVFDGLSRVFTPKTHTLLRQVRNGTGYVDTVRTADALALSYWPTRGLYMNGIEIKITRADWLRELEHPEKSDEIGQYCRYWYIAAPAGIVPVGELPEGWGLIEMSPKAKIVHEATQRDAVPPTMAFVCAIARKLADGTVPLEEVEGRAAEMVESRKTSEKVKLDKLRLEVEQFETESGMKITGSHAWEPIGRSVRFVQETGIGNAVQTARRLQREAQSIVDQIERALEKHNDPA